MNLKVWCCIHKSPLYVPILIQINPVPAFPTHLIKIHFNIILLSVPRCSRWSFVLQAVPPKPCIQSPLPHTCHMPHPSHSCLSNYCWHPLHLNRILHYYNDIFSHSFGTTISENWLHFWLWFLLLLSLLSVKRGFSTVVPFYQNETRCLHYSDDIAFFWKSLWVMNGALLLAVT